jgi:hypothetical protein
MNNAIDNATKAVSFFDFHGMTMLVTRHQGKRYVEAKPFGDLLGMRWRTLRETLQSGDNAILYGTKRLIPPVFNIFVAKNDRLNESGIEVSGPPRGPLDPVCDVVEDGSETENTSENGVLHILFERVQMFLARVNTTQMRVQGNVMGANYLLALQIEWAQVLHQYEAGDVVSKKGRMDDQAFVANLMKTRALAKPYELAAFDRMLRDAMADMGYQLDFDPQQALPLSP